MKTRTWLVGILAVLSIWSCDTASSIDPPENSFFVKYYGNNGNQEGVDGVLNVDGTITLFGTTEDTLSGNIVKQFYLVNVEQNGRLVWGKTIPTAKSAIAKDLELTNDGRLVIVGDIVNAPLERDILVMTLTLTGDVINNYLIALSDANGPTNEMVSSVTQTNDGFIVSGSTTNLEIDPSTSPTDTQDALHIRLTDNLVEFGPVWPQTSGAGNIDFAVKTFQISQVSSESIIFGYTDEISINPQSLNFYYESLGYSGESTGKGFIDVDVSDEYLSSVILSPIQNGGDGYLLTGVTKTGTSTDIFIVKLNKGFQQQFKKTYGINLGLTTSDRVTAFPSIRSGFFVLANFESGGKQNFFLNKIDNQGNEAWSNPVIFGGEYNDEVGAVLELPDGSIGIVGTFRVGQDGEKKMTFIKVNREGKFSK